MLSGRDGEGIDVQDVEGNTPLHLACCMGHTKTVNMLIERGANIRLRNEYGSTREARTL